MKAVSSGDFLRFIHLMRNPSRVPRRDAYLFTWGIGYVLLSASWAALNRYWGLIFMVVGLVAVLGAISNAYYFKGIAFGFLSGAAILHATNFIWPLPFIALSMPRPMIIVWIAIAMAHVVVAGWPTHCIEHQKAISNERPSDEVHQKD